MARSSSAGTIADLILRRGDIAAEHAQRSGQINANLVGSLGDLAQNGLLNYQQQEQQRIANERQTRLDAERTATNEQQRELTGLQIDGARTQQANQAHAREVEQAARNISMAANEGQDDKVLEITRQANPDAFPLVQTFLDNRKKRNTEDRLERAQAAVAFKGDPVATRSLVMLDHSPGAMDHFLEQTGGGLDPAKNLAYAQSVLQGITGHAPAAPPGPIKLGQGEILVPPTGGQPIATNPRPETPAPGFNLGPGQTRFDASGKPIASLPASPAKEPRLTPNVALQMTRSLRNDFTRETKAASTVEQQLALMRSAVDSAKAGKMNPGSQGVLVTFQKILDPSSVVRESEYARSPEGLSLIGRLQGSWQKLSEGGAGVRVQDLEEFLSTAESFATSQRAFANETKSQIDKIAETYQLDPSLITRDVGAVNTRTPTGVPDVGSTFQGGRVLRVTPIP